MLNLADVIRRGVQSSRIYGIQVCKPEVYLQDAERRGLEDRCSIYEEINFLGLIKFSIPPLLP